MENLTFYTYPSCTSCRKTKSWLNDHHIHFKERHLFREKPDVDELMNIIRLTTDGLTEILATRSMTYKTLDVDLDELPLSQVLQIICDEPRLLRRPIITDGKKLVIGYNVQGLAQLGHESREQQRQAASF